MSASRLPDWDWLDQELIYSRQFFMKNFLEHHNYDLSDDLLAFFSQALEKMLAYVTDINIYNCKFSAQMMKALANAVKNNHSLERIEFYNSKIENSAISLQACIDIVSHGTSLKTFHLTQSFKLNKESATSLATAIANNKNIIHISLDFDTTSEIITNAMTPLLNHPTLESMMLTGFVPNRADIQALGTVIGSIVSLNRLFLEGWCSEQTERVAFNHLICSLIKNHPSLKAIRTHGFYFENALALNIIDALTDNSNLVALEIFPRCFPTESYLKILDIIEKNKNILIFNLREYRHHGYENAPADNQIHQSIDDQLANNIKLCLEKERENFAQLQGCADNNIFEATFAKLIFLISITSNRNKHQEAFIKGLKEGMHFAINHYFKTEQLSAYLAAITHDMFSREEKTAFFARLTRWIDEKKMDSNDKERWQMALLSFAQFTVTNNNNTQTNYLKYLVAKYLASKSNQHCPSPICNDRLGLFPSYFFDEKLYKSFLFSYEVDTFAVIERKALKSLLKKCFLQTHHRTDAWRSLLYNAEDLTPADLLMLADIEPLKGMLIANYQTHVIVLLDHIAMRPSEFPLKPSCKKELHEFWELAFKSEKKANLCDISLQNNVLSLLHPNPITASANSKNVIN